MTSTTQTMQRTNQTYVCAFAGNWYIWRHSLESGAFFLWTMSFDPYELLRLRRFHVNAFLSKEPQAPKTPILHHNPAMETIELFIQVCEKS